MGSQTSSSRHQALSDVHQTGIPGIHVGGINVGQTHIQGATGTTMQLPSEMHIGGLGGLHAVLPGADQSFASQTPNRNRRDVEQLQLLANEKIPCVFTWSHGGHNVYVTGSFNNWSVENKLKLVSEGPCSPQVVCSNCSLLKA